ncbi:MAG TPA: tyrosine-type recombinase/integrase [Accumulibacter sp.]|uniref:tyrosine-type recombinase/integrase n=2 Tax=Accumulibacter sp. TaxID=2053492 RepID=UPI002C2E5602|nr:tyrosine-type recombinase/integrase [Accumulibacter sp.]HNC26836.1 tyrosine-type recombinase/integrase [Accumulibacter sp.]HND39119.1 tyrosine-type recombinase/integrase [Accumulibacter sp.]HNE40607.1 tyrosine-type recombinase/integrase [Accumulibacter sp.]HNG87834.1 tyrosine-type recombinase/integrase [Accumulibacter sp.]HNI50814.1 tyrosine-type recombinase/integrase [Accumulibacter sp.]
MALQKLELPPVGKRLTIYDEKVPKLALRVTAAGTKTFYVVKRAGTEMAWVKLGAFPEMTVEKAQAEAERILGEFATGANPAKVRRAFKAEPTLTEFFSEYGTRHGNKLAVWRDMQQRFWDYLQKPLGDKKLTAINRAMIARVLSDVEKAGKAAATVRLVRALASGMFSKAIEWGYLDANPAHGVKVAGRVVTRDRFLQPDELPRFFAALAEEPSIAMRDFILLALLTGARRANVCAMHWREIDLAAGNWRLPVTKNGTPQTVTLCPEAVEILKARQEATAGGFVFPGTGATGHMVEPKKAVIRIMERAGIPYGRNDPNGVTLHDLRRTMGSWQARTGASLAIIGKSLNHKSQQATAIYARLDLDPVRASVNTATAAMLEAGGMKLAAEVLPLAKRGAA